MPNDLDFIRSSINSGNYYGYPECCIKEFVKYPPSKMKFLNKKESEIRYRAGHLHGNFTGFIPCLKHAKEILSGNITLVSLIKTTRETPIQFPYDWNRQ